MSESDIHTCSYQCHRPECIKAQRDELRNRFTTLETEYTQLSERIAQLEAERPELELENNYLRADLAETEAKLAALREGGEPVAWLCETDGNVDAVVTEHAKETYAKCGRKITPLYTAPPPAIPESRVPEAISPGDWPGDPTPAFADGWNACRDAMLAAQQEKNDD
jgi:regulator of replication initiation timing